MYEDSGVVDSKHRERVARYDGTASDKSSKYAMSTLVNKHVSEHAQGMQPMSYYKGQMLANASPQEHAMPAPLQLA